MKDVITPVPRVLLSATLAGPAPSGGAGTSRLCQGCSRPPRHHPDQAALSFTALLRQDGGEGLSPPLEQTAPHGAGPRTATPCSPPARSGHRPARRTGPATRADAAGRPGSPGPVSAPRLPVSRYSNVSWRRCTSNAPTMLMRDLLELRTQLGHGTCSQSPYVVDAATTDAGEVPSHGIFDHSQRADSPPLANRGDTSAACPARGRMPGRSASSTTRSRTIASWSTLESSHVAA
jgi:hypothetical protein